jgi:ketosteroid isomerase-like protein
MNIPRDFPGAPPSGCAPETGGQIIYRIKEKPTMKADSMTEAAVKAVLDKVAESYAKRDLVLLRAAFAPDPDVMMYGTGADEKRVGVAEAERDWSQTEAAAMTYGWTSVSAAGSVAWAATDATFKLKAGGQEMTLPARITFVLEKRAEEWLIVQAHFSFPATGQAEGESFPTE